MNSWIQETLRWRLTGTVGGGTDTASTVGRDAARCLCADYTPCALGQLAVVVMAALVTGSLLLLPGEGLHWRGDDAVVGAEPALTGPVQHPDTMMDESSLTEMDVLMSNEDVILEKKSGYL
ncbi:MAG: hypothetical protein R3E89_00815 [Thiolinea sp.]